MVVYLDLIFMLNSVADWAALYVTARLSGMPASKRRLLAASVLGGTYGVLCALPGLSFFAGFLLRLLAAAGLVYLVFGRRGSFLRQLLLFFMISCALGGALLASLRAAQDGMGAEVLKKLNWKVFLLAGGSCYLALSVVFRNGARHALRGELTAVELSYRGRSAGLTALRDTGHTLTDPVTGAEVLVAEWAALDALWDDRERAALARRESDGPAAVLEQLERGRFRLLSYRAVGVSAGLLLCFRPDRAAVGGAPRPGLVVALSPTPVSDGGGYAALWGGAERGEEHHAA